MGLSLRWWRNEDEAHRKELKKLQQQAELAEAKLRLAKADDEVLKAEKLNAVISTLTKGLKSRDDQLKVIRTLGAECGLEELSQEMLGEKKLDMLRELKEEDIRKAKEIMGLHRKEQLAIGFEGDERNVMKRRKGE